MAVRPGRLARSGSARSGSARSGSVCRGGLSGLSRRVGDLGRDDLGGDLLGHLCIGLQVVRRAQQRRLVGLAGVDLGDHPATEDDDRPVAGELDLLELRGVEQDGGAGLREVAEQHVDLLLRADVDAAGRVEAEHRVHATGDPAGDRHLLLVAAGQAADLALRPRVDLQPGDAVVDLRALDAVY